MIPEMKLAARNGKIRSAIFLMTLGILSTLIFSSAQAERISNIANTKHNFSASQTSGVRSTSEDELCVFCHTPHGSSTATAGPLWNRALSTATYTTYTSTSLDTDTLGQPGGSSKLCLSCHDGTIAIGNVNVLSGQATDQNSNTEDIQNMIGTGASGVIPDGYGANTGFTRNLGTDLTNDHPISFTYNTSLAIADTELATPTLSDPGGSKAWITSRGAGIRPDVPLENGEVQCTTCHDPHIWESTGKNIKFLRLNRFQETSHPIADQQFNQANDIICLACHEKDGWAGSAHANSSIANETYVNAEATLRDFPTRIKVWEAACLNCHDTHTVQGARRLLREGTDSGAHPKSGGSSAIEETCYQCHTSDSDIAIDNSAGQVPKIEQDFTTTGNSKMPIDLSPEDHDIKNNNFEENKTNLGIGKRHVECTDCHNPHRVIRCQRYDDDAFNCASTYGTKAHGDPNNSSAVPSNIASGVLRGSVGIEPKTWTSNAWGALIATYDELKGLPTDGTATWVTKEYQVCLRCHSSYAYGSTPPAQGCCSDYTTSDDEYSGSPKGSRGTANYTDQGMEFQPTGTGESSATHRSWHPVIAATGRTTSARGGMTSSFWNAPFDRGIGTQTMYCTDCHGADRTSQDSRRQSNTNEGPHGSSNNFILKGAYDQGTGGGSSDDLCFKCHNYTRYTTKDGGGTSGFCCHKANNLHAYHSDKISGGIRCNFCHVAIPHGWKNKALLVNLNEETGLTTVSAGFRTKAPYIRNASLKVKTWKTSGNWQAGDCGPTSGTAGRDWMRSACGGQP